MSIVTIHSALAFLNYRRAQQSDQGNARQQHLREPFETDGPRLVGRSVLIYGVKSQAVVVGPRVPLSVANVSVAAGGG